MKDVIELAKQAGIRWDVESDCSEWRLRRSELENLVALVRNAALTEAIDKARIFGLGLPIAQIERLIKALESLKEPTP